ncbi:hypothetical protein HWV62_31181 [Athelia sp. TMB]|nr:hypothetical protein HWV62_31181 [Athelia sp. TMB]
MPGAPQMWLSKTTHCLCVQCRIVGVNQVYGHCTSVVDAPCAKFEDLQGLSGKTRLSKANTAAIREIVLGIAPPRPQTPAARGPVHRYSMPCLNYGGCNKFDAGRWYTIPLDRQSQKISNRPLMYLTPPIDTNIIKTSLDDRFAAKDAIEAMGSLQSRKLTTSANSYLNRSSSSTQSMVHGTDDLEEPLPPPDAVVAHGDRTDDGLPVTLLVYDMNNEPAKQLSVHADNCRLLRLSKLKVLLGELGIELGIMQMQFYQRRKWIDVHSDSPLLVRADRVVIFRVKGVTAMKSWEIDSALFN